MKVTVKGPGVSPGAIHALLEDFENEYGMKIRDLTLYVRFVDNSGKIVDPKLPGNGSELVVNVEKKRREAEVPAAQEYDEQIQREFDRIKDEFLSAGIEEEVIKRAFEATWYHNDGRVPVPYLRKIVEHFNRKGIRTREQLQEYMRIPILGARYGRRENH